MTLVPLLSGVQVHDYPVHLDDRGEFRRLFDSQRILDEGGDSRVSHVSFSNNIRRGVLRGMHYLNFSAGETKTVACVEGEIFDVIIDARPSSPTYLDHMAVILGGGRAASLTLPPGLAHGFITLTQEASIVYLMSIPYASSEERGFRYDDPVLGIDWPLVPTTVSKKDKCWPLIETQA